jgi:glycosyltransferase involved in cell wall biosynthesis
LREINSNNLFLSLEPLPYEQIDKIYASATIGLAFYKDWDNNLSQISKASGKLSQYLKHGKPVLVNNLESLSQVVEKYKIGVVIKDPLNTLEIEAAIETILNNYAFYSENTKTCFEEEFDFAKKVKPILAFMADL